MGYCGRQLCIHKLETTLIYPQKRCQTLHLQGPGALGCFDPHILGLSYRDADLTFAERINELADILKQSKNRVMNLLRGHVMSEYLLVPSTLMQNTKGNQKQNAHRQGILSEHRDRYKTNHKTPNGNSRGSQGNYIALH